MKYHQQTFLSNFYKEIIIENTHQSYGENIVSGNDVIQIEIEKEVRVTNGGLHR